MSFYIFRSYQDWQWRSGPITTAGGKQVWSPCASQEPVVKEQQVYVHVPCKKYDSTAFEKFCGAVGITVILIGLGSIMLVHSDSRGAQTENRIYWMLASYLLILIGCWPAWKAIKYFYLSLNPPKIKSDTPIKCDCGRHKGQWIGKETKQVYDANVY